MVWDEVQRSLKAFSSFLPELYFIEVNKFEY